MRWLRERWAWRDRRSNKRTDAAETGGGPLSYEELIRAAAGEDTALDARLRQSAERISSQDESAEV